MGERVPGVAAPGDRVTLHYRLSTPEGAEILSTFHWEPVQVRLGSDDLHPNLQRCVEGLACGERHRFYLQAAAAFGVGDSALEQEVPLETFPADLTPKPENLIEFTLPNGVTVSGIVRSVTDSAARVDFNHPLSGCDVVFEVEVLRIDE